MCSKHNPTLGLSKEQIAKHWIDESIKKYGDKFDYSKIKSIERKSSDVLITCPSHGLLKTTLARHLESSMGCPQCGKESSFSNRKMSFEEFMRRLDEVNPYRKFKVITREFSPDFILKRDYVYIQSKFGIHKALAWGLISSKNPSNPSIANAVSPLQYFINQARELHNYKYTFESFEYKGAKVPSVATCHKHGHFETYANNILSGRGCPKCFKDNRKYYLRSDTNKFVKKAMDRLGTSKDIYDKCEYVNAKSKVLIKCHSHGYYSITPNDHLTGYGCMKCASETSAWSLKDYIKICKDRKPCFYKVRMFNDTEDFIKIGITVQGIDKRYGNNGGFKLSGYKYEVLKIIEGEAEYIWKLERRFLKMFSQYRYYPKNKFQGHTECFLPQLKFC